MAINDVFKCILSHDVPGAPGNPSTGFFYRQTSDAIGIEGTDLVADVAEAWLVTALPAYRALLEDSISLLQIEVYNLSDVLYSATVGINLPGLLTAADDELTSLRSAPVVSLRTGKVGRSYRGRQYLMPLAEGHQANGVIGGFYEALVQTYFADARVVQSGPLDNVYIHSVYSKTLSEVAGSPVDNLVKSVRLNSKLGSQRNRVKDIR